MPARKRNLSGGSAWATTRQGDVEREIATFLRAMYSYPESFAHNPQRTFEQHLMTITTEAEAELRRHS
jgi:hypothetical protein